MPGKRIRMLVIVGTGHIIQRTSSDLRLLLEHICQNFTISAIAEEMSYEALFESKCVTSAPLQVAKKLQIPHRFCDPNRTERKAHGIDQENDIRARAFLSSQNPSESEIKKRIDINNFKREKYWLNQILDLDVWPVLFICGANHVTSFSNLIKSHGFIAHIHAKDWKP